MSKEQIFSDLSDLYDSTEMPAGKKKVLQSALDLFAKQGFDGTSTAQIATASGMSQATIFKYFKTKEDLLAAIIEPLLNHLLPNYVADFTTLFNQQEPDLKQLIHFFVFNRFEFIYDNRQAALILVTEMLTDDKVLKQVKTKLSEFAPKVKSQVWSRISHAKNFNPALSFQAFIRLLISVIGGYFLQRIKFDREIKADTEKDLNVLVDEIYRAITI